MPSEAITSSDWVKTYGPLGLLAIIGIVAAVYLFRVLQSERKSFEKTLIDMAKEHKTEMKAMVERHIATTTTQIGQYYNLAEKLHTLIESALRRLDRRQG